MVYLNKKLEDEPALINEDAYGKGWIYSAEIENTSELDSLMSNSEYEEFIKK